MKETQEKEIKKDNRGGKREGAGRKKSENSKDIKSRYWQVVLYPENMIDNWEDELIKLGLPIAYCLHTDSTSEKPHIHMIGAWENNTTYKSAFEFFERLNKENQKAFNKIEKCFNIENAYNYLIHDTDDCRKKGKYQYKKEDRKCINNFDIHFYAQKSVEQEEEQINEICDVIITEVYTNFIDLYMHIKSNYDKDYLTTLRKHSGFFERLTKGNYHKEIEEEMIKHRMGYYTKE